MKRLMIMLAVVGSAPISAQTKSAAAAPSTAAVCASLATSYDDASKTLAANYAEGVGDNSAPRAALRATEDANSLAQAHMTLDLMRDFRCPMPKSAPFAIFYLLPALTCATDRLKMSGSKSPPSCERAKWERSALK